MRKNLEFSELLRLIDERSNAFRAAVISAPGLGVKVPTCPEWTLLDLVQHLGAVQRFWASVVTAGPADSAPEKSELEVFEAAPREREELLAWSSESTELLLGALREAGPDSGCWTWWGGSQSPQNSGAVARHQVQEVLVHTYDAQITAGVPQPLLEEAALDGIDEFLTTCCATTEAWPHEAVVLEFHAVEGGSWRLSLSADGATAGTAGTAAAAVAAATASATASASVRGTASELVLALYSRTPLDTLQIDGDRRHFELLLDWDPDE